MSKQVGRTWCKGEGEGNKLISKQKNQTTQKQKNSDKQ